MQMNVVQSLRQTSLLLAGTWGLSENIFQLNPQASIEYAFDLNKLVKENEVEA